MYSLTPKRALKKSFFSSKLTAVPKPDEQTRVPRYTQKKQSMLLQTRMAFRRFWGLTPLQLETRFRNKLFGFSIGRG